MSFITANHNPDVLSCLANLSNDEVFTPPKLVNDILDMLPDHLWTNPKAKFLDPATKTGVFLREIIKRLLIGLEEEIPDLQQRINHICTKQIYGIGITDMTSKLSRRAVYCSKTANGKYSVCTNFKNESGNIFFNNIEHTWQGSSCKYCGATKSIYKRSDELETHAYEFIHGITIKEIKNMQWDVIIGNPPYQLSDGGNGTSAKPIYHYFVDQAKKLSPRYLAMIIPSRWFSGGKGLDTFRESMLNDKRVRKIVDYENSAEVFPGVDVAGGICYFLWDRDSEGSCEVTNYHDGKAIALNRDLDEFDIFIRNSRAVPIVRKVQAKNEGGKYLKDVVSARKPFGLPTNYEPKASGVPCWFIQRIGLKYADRFDISDQKDLLKKWKFLIPKAPIAGQTDFSKPVGFYYDGNTRIAKPGECCTESWIVAGAFDSEEEVLSFKSYIFTKTVRFLILQTVVSQDVTKKNFCFVPDLGKYEGIYTDDYLCKKWDITDEEWDFIESKINNIGGDKDE